MRKQFLLVPVMVTCLAALSPIAFAQKPGEVNLHKNNAPALVGAWSIDVTPTLVPAFASLGTFSADGTLTNISSPSLGVPPESPGYGEWVQVGRHRFAVTFHTLMGDGAGNLAGRQKVRATITVGPKGDKLNGVFQVDVFDATGGLIVSDTGTVQGRRLTVEALP
jgi:hypothetical protein